MSDNELLDIDPIKDAPLSPSVAISALAMNFALKYCDINTVQEGALYQQYKLEGRNMTGLCMDEVLHYARQFEAWLLSGENRHIELMKGEIVEGFISTAMDVLGEVIEADDGTAGAA